MGQIDVLKNIVYFLVLLGIVSVYLDKVRLAKTKTATFPPTNENLFRKLDLTPFPSFIGHNALNTSRGLPLSSKRVNPLWLKVGDLPGYTGWGRPSSSTASWYKVIFLDSPTVGLPYSIDILCQHHDCRHLNAAFYIRAYGPTVLTGTILRTEQFNSTIYKATFFFQEPGEYVVEVVLAFSHLPPIQEFPSDNEPSYEGYLLPEMPALLTVHPSFPRLTQNETPPICGLNEIYESSLTSALERGTWSVVERVVSAGAFPSPQHSYTLEGYQQGPLSLGIRMQYKTFGCRLPPILELTREFSSLENIHIAILGDSNMYNLHNAIQAVLGDHFTNMHYIKASDGLNVRFAEIRQAFQELSQSAKTTDKFYLLFNAGLHEITRLCSKRFIHSRQEIISIPDEEFSCAEEYRKNLEELVLITKSMPLELQVFQSTPAGWLKYGNWGFAWPPDSRQEYPLDSHTCGEFNQIAWEIMAKHEIHWVDAYWLSLSRPDHREINRENSKGKKLVHLGGEIYESLVQKWLTLILLKAKQAQPPTNL